MAVLLPTISSSPTAALSKPLKQKSNEPHFTSPVLPVRLSSFIPTPTRASLASNHHVSVVVIAATKLPHPRMRIVGLTGGISSGKSTVSNLFKASDIPVVDADLVARDVLKKGTGGWKKVVKAFGEEIILDNGEMDRPKLGSIVFSDPTKRQLLNRLLAPYISSGILKEVLKLWLKGHKVIVLDVPLLFEAKLDKWTNPVIVVWVDHGTQLQRLKARDGISDEEARNRINAQMSLDSKRSKADIVIDNNGSREDLSIQFQDVSRVVNRPLTWGEFMRSRQGVFSAVVLCVTGFIFSRKV